MSRPQSEAEILMRSFTVVRSLGRVSFRCEHVFGFFLYRMMAANDPVQERQLVLMERMSRRIDSILEGQKKLEDTNAVLQQENAKLKNQLASLEGQAKKKGNKRSKSSRRESNVVIPNDLRVNIL